MTIEQRILLATLAAPWVVLAGLLWWNPQRMGGSPRWGRLCVYAFAAMLWAYAAWGIYL